MPKYYDPTDDIRLVPAKVELEPVELVRPPIVEITTIPNVGNVMDNALVTIHREIEILAEKSYNGGLSSAETRQFSEYIKALQSIINMRDQMMRAGKVEQLPDDELISKVQSILKEVDL